MIKIFKNIRQKLITNGRVSKYLIYALGEIALVMIGILLALQVNNWNEQRKAKIFEKKLLNEYVVELDYNLDAAKGFEQDLLSRVHCTQYILDAIEDRTPLTDSLTSCFYVLTRTVDSYFSHKSYNALTSQGLDVISNDSIKHKVIDFHTFQYERIESRIENQISNIREYGRPIMRHRMKTIGNSIFMPVNYDELMQDVLLWNVLRTLNGNFVDLVSYTKELQREIIELDRVIDAYIKD